MSSRLLAAVRWMPLLSRFLVVGAGPAGAAGGIAGLVLGLRAYPPTAWFAVFEVAIPAAAIGAILGVFSGVLTAAAR